MAGACKEEPHTIIRETFNLQLQVGNRGEQPAAVAQGFGWMIFIIISLQRKVGYSAVPSVVLISFLFCFVTTSDIRGFFFAGVSFGSQACVCRFLLGEGTEAKIGIKLTNENFWSRVLQVPPKTLYTSIGKCLQMRCVDGIEGAYGQRNSTTFLR